MKAFFTTELRQYKSYSLKPEQVVCGGQERYFQNYEHTFKQGVAIPIAASCF